MADSPERHDVIGEVERVVAAQRDELTRHEIDYLHVAGIPREQRDRRPQDAARAEPRTTVWLEDLNLRPPARTEASHYDEFQAAWYVAADLRGSAYVGGEQPLGDPCRWHVSC